ncbi:Aspartate beta-hydroxylase domain-containing protein 2 [Balamuthia mandrillaris]
MSKDTGEDMSQDTGEDMSKDRSMYRREDKRYITEKAANRRRNEMFRLEESYPERLKACIRMLACRKTPPQGKHPQQQPSYLLFPGLKAKPWWEREELEGPVKALEGAYEEIKEECMAVVREMEEQGEGLDRKGKEEEEEPTMAYLQRRQAQRDDGTLKDPFVRPSYLWGCFWLWKDGERIEPNCAKCPKTVAVVESLRPALMDGFPQCHVYFSLLEPGAWIRPHYGPANLRLRAHLGLVVPPKDCYVEVAGEARSWKEGQCILFDDSFEHQVRHQGEGYRIVLIVDLWHPELSAEEVDALKRWSAYWQ